MHRRQFLGAAAAALSLPADGRQSDGGPGVEVDSGGYGGTRTRVESGDAVFGSVYLSDINDDESSVAVNGYHYDDMPPEVECTITLDSASVNLNFEPERARRLADELRQAATAAEQGGLDGA